MSEIVKQTPLKPLYPVSPVRKPHRREQPDTSHQQQKKNNSPPDEKDEQPRVDEYA